LATAWMPLAVSDGGQVGGLEPATRTAICTATTLYVCGPTSSSVYQSLRCADLSPSEPVHLAPR